MSVTIPEPMMSARAEIFSGYSDLVERLGENPNALLAKVNLVATALEDMDNRVNYNSLRELFQISAKACNTPFFGLRLAEHQPVETIGIAGQLARLCPNLRLALRSAFKYMQLQSEGSSWHLEETESFAYIYRKERLPNQYSMDQLVIYNLAKVCIYLRALLGNNWTPSRVLFDFAQPEEINELKQFFRAPLQFDQEYPGILLPAKVLDEPLDFADSILYRAVEKNAQQKIENAPFQLDLVNQVKELIVQGLESGQGDAVTIAKTISMHPKTLQRRLAACGFSFRELENKVKIDMSKRYLMTTDKSISEISSLLGYGSLSAFTRAFKKKTGQSPIGWRRSQKYKVID